LALITEEGLSVSEMVQRIVDVVRKRISMGKSYGVILVPEGLAELLASDGPRDPHGNLEVSKIATEEQLVRLVQKELTGTKFAAQTHFLGYEGRCCLPTNFDATYAYSLGLLAALAVRDCKTGVICAIQNLAREVSQWQFKLVPLVSLMHFEMRTGKNIPVIQKYLVDIKSLSFTKSLQERNSWELQDAYLCPGPIQFWGDSLFTDRPPECLRSVD
jgi:pyrophosphate--fructose-6-phosphate 1-phosphotransferase